MMQRWDLASALTLAAGTTGLTLVLPVEGPVRIVPAIVFVLALPGYLATCALFPRANDLSGPERLALSLGLSMAIVPLVGLALNFSPWGIRLTPVVLSLDALAAVLAFATDFQRRRLGESAFVPDWPGGRAPSRADLAAIAFVGLAGVGGFAAVRLTLGESPSQDFTEFAMVGPSGTLTDLPTTLAPGALTRIRLMVANHENSSVAYEIRPRLDVLSLPTVEIGNLANGVEWDQPYAVAMPTAVGRHELAFDLYRTDEPGVYRHLSLRVDITASGLPEPHASATPVPSQP